MRHIKWYQDHFLGAELVIAVIATLLMMLWAWRGGAPAILAVVSHNQSSIYGALASVDGSLLGFAITTVSIVLGFMATDRLAPVRAHPASDMLWAVFRSCIRVLALATVVALIGLIVDRDSNPSVFLLLVCGGIQILAVFRVARCIWILEYMVRIVTKRAQ